MDGDASEEALWGGASVGAELGDEERPLFPLAPSEEEELEEAWVPYPPPLPIADLSAGGRFFTWLAKEDSPSWS